MIETKPTWEQLRQALDAAKHAMADVRGHVRSEDARRPLDWAIGAAEGVLLLCPVEPAEPVAGEFSQTLARVAASASHIPAWKHGSAKRGIRADVVDRGCGLEDDAEARSGGK
jgi:hypothetical protein